MASFFPTGPRAITFAAMLISTFVIVSILIGESYFLSQSNVSPLIGLPVLAISGLVLLLCAISAVSIVFAAFGLSDKTQALGLPDGSIRSVIALSLVLLFGILSIFLFQSISSSHQGAKYVGLNEDDARQLVLKAPAGAITDVASADGKTHTVYVRDTADQTSNDIAKQIITVMATLVTAIASFYFGSSAVASAAATISGPDPAQASRLLSLEPTTAKAGVTTTLAIAGRNLARAVAVRAADQSMEIKAKLVSVTDSSIKCDLAPPSGASPGQWTIVVSTDSGEYSLLNALTVTA